MRHAFAFKLRLCSADRCTSRTPIQNLQVRIEQNIAPEKPLPPWRPMIRILFVDDEVRILEGVRRSMHCMRGEWQMRFECSAALALKALATESADVVVSDMRMPGMEGSQLLSEVKRLYPQAVRIILSGQSEPDSVVRATRTAHQYLSKPCEAQTLKSAISRTTDLRAILSSDKLLAIVGNVDALPTAPQIYHKLLECLRDPLATIDSLAEIIRQDVAMTAKVVMLANSGFFGIREPVQTLERAVSFVGMEAISTLVLGQELFANTGSITLPGFDLERLSRHSFETGAWARAIALHESLGRTLADTAFLAGVLHDVGQLVIATRPVPAPGQDAPAGSTETIALMTIQSASVGAYLLGLWGFPDPIVEAIVWQHTPSKCHDTALGLCGLLHIGNALALERERPTDGLYPMVEPGYLEALGLADRWSDWRATRPAPDPGRPSVN